MVLNFLLNQVMRPKSGEITIERRLEKLPHYGKAWINAYKSSWDEEAD